MQHSKPHTTTSRQTSQAFRTTVTSAMVFACVNLAAQPAWAAASVSQDSALPGTFVQRKDTTVQLYPGKIAVGDDFKKLATLLGLELKGIAVISIVPSIDTKVCEEQSHIMSESSDLKPGIQRIIISRDTPMAQERFVREAKLSNLTLASDFAHGTFGKNTGLLMRGPELLARAVLVTDAKGIIRYLQVARDITTLPDMKAAFKVANSLDVQP